MPEIIEGNKDIWNLFNICSNQWRAGFSGPSGFDFSVAIEVAKAMGIEINQSFFEKLRAYEVTTLNEIGKRSKDEKD